MKELPYEFDLLYDIKMMYEIETVAKGEPSHSDATPEELVELFEKYQIPKPACLMKFSNIKKISDCLLVVSILDGLVERVFHCKSAKEQENKFKELVIKKSGFEPEECDYEDGYYEYAKCCSICITSCS